MLDTRVFVRDEPFLDEQLRSFLERDQRVYALVFADAHEPLGDDLHLLGESGFPLQQFLLLFHEFGHVLALFTRSGRVLFLNAGAVLAEPPRR